MAKIEKKEKLKSANNSSLLKIKLKSANEVSEFAENIINTVRELLLLLDKDLRVVKASQSFYDFFKVTSGETIGTLIYNLGNNQWDIPKLRELLETILPEKTTFDNFEVEYVFSTIGKRIMLLNARKIQRGSAKEHLILLAIEDITELKKAEKALQRSELRFRTLFENVKIGLYRTKPDGTILMANKALVKMLGYPSFEKIAERNLGKDIYEPTYQRKEFLEKIEKDGEIIDFESVWVRQDGSEFFVRESAQTIRDSQGTTLYYDGMVEDITERKHAEVEVRESEERFRMVFENVFDGISIYVEDPDPSKRRLVECNERYSILAGRSRDELFQLGSTLGLQITLESKANVNRLESIDRGTAYQGYFSWIRPDGKENVIEYVGMPISWQGKSYTIGIDRDITERKKAEEEINKTNKELEKLNFEKDKLFSIIAHDLRSPFHGLLGLTEVMATDIPIMSSAEITEYSNSLHDLVVNLYALLENLLEWAQFQKGSIGFTPKTLCLSDIFSQNIDSIKQRALQKGITIFNEISETQNIYADEKMINSVLRNLLSNAVKFTKKGGKVVGKAREIEKGMVEISVTDTGVGIPGNTVGKLFMLGEKVGSKGTDNEPSTGLGLVLCKEFVEKHGGQIWVESKVNVGTTFYFTLPSTDKNNT